MKQYCQKLGSPPNSASATKHSLIIFTSVFLTAEILALFLTPVNDGIATADNIAKTAITTTSSIRENPWFVKSLFKKKFF